jgi:hypothetical protein
MASRSILIVGLGKVAIGYDLMKNSNLRRSHLFSIYEYGQQNRLEFVVYAVEPDLKARQSALRAFPNILCFPSLADIPPIEFDLVLVCTPIEVSFDVTVEILRSLRFKQLLLEKPGVNSKLEAKSLNSLLTVRSDVSILYPRRCLPSSHSLKGLISSFESLKWDIEIEYSGSAKNILSHFIDFVEYLFSQESTESLWDRYSLTTKQTSNQNNNDHRIKISGPVQVDYLEGGKHLIVRDGNKVLESVDARSEIDSQIWHEVNGYLEIDPEGQAMFPGGISASISEILD